MQTKNLAPSWPAVGLATLLAAGTAHAQPADLILTNGNVWTVDADKPRAQAVAARGDTIVFVGGNRGALRLRGPTTRVIDLKGRMLLPGFNDNHVHFDQTGRLLYGLNLLDVSNAKDFTQRIRQIHRRYPKGTWITGGDWSAYETWSAGKVAKAGRKDDRSHPYGNFFLPDRILIDRFTRDRPVLVNRFDRKVYLANRAALERAGIRKGVPDPKGIVVRRSRSGEPTGALFNPIGGGVDSTLLVKDNVKALFEPLIPPPSRAQRVLETKAAWKKMRQVGVTSYVDVTSAPIQVDIYRELRERGEMTARVYYRPPLDKWQAMADLGIQVGFGDAWIRFGSVKAWIDGIMGNSSARFYEPYTHQPDRRGIWRDIMYPFERSPDDPEQMQSRLERLALKADAANLQLSVHAIGDEANGYLLDMLERLIKKNGEKDRRFRLIHAQVMTDKDIERAGKLKIVAEMQPFHVSDDMRWMEERIGAERSRGAYAFRRIWDSGAVLCFGSDSPGTNASRYYLNPMLGLYAAVTRKTLSGQPKGGWFPNERITIQEAIQAYTLNSAYASFEEKIKGSITVGKLADLVVVSDDLLSMPADRIKDAKVLMTFVGGRLVYSGKKD